MKRTIVFLSLMLTAFVATAQQTWWVFLADKAGTTFDPYTYFDAKAIERYQQCGANLYDISNYPVSPAYEQGVSALATEEIGASRWMNAVGVVATPAQVQAIEALPYVLRVQPIEGSGMQVANCSDADTLDGLFDVAKVDGPLSAQLVRMGGKAFRDRGIDGRGIRIAVFDGGFPQVNTHDAFKHLRDNHQIIKTWNFPKKKENVYGWNSHGTMTLSCIAGRENVQDLGLATGAEFLLARTEVNSEPFKEEVWWQMAVEWADKNGANIISSSLGYGKERHYTTDMDGTSYVAKAGNLAARKGILVCNSAGNEAEDNQWKTIITPADADSVLCIGGIENSLTEYNHISFSSHGPSADGRLKPNVCAFGYARTANVGKDNDFHYVHGTSFSCPLVAGFAACAWQASPGKTAMQMFDAIQRSADLYPYCDYTFGYGVPQATYFTGAPKAVAPTFRFVQEDCGIKVKFLVNVSNKPMFSKEQSGDGHIYHYFKHDIDFADTSSFMRFAVPSGRTLVVCLNGYTDSIVSRPNCSNDDPDGVEMYSNIRVADVTYRTPEANLTPSQWGSNAKYRYNFYFGLGLPVKTADAELASNVWSPSVSLAVRLLRAFSKSYCLGIGLEYSSSNYLFNGADNPNDLEALYPSVVAALPTFDEVDTRKVRIGEWSLELFQRIRLLPLGIVGNGLHWDLGVYGSLGMNTYLLEGEMPSGTGYDEMDLSLRSLDALSAYRWNFGLTTRLAYDWIGISARYRLNSIGSDPEAGKVLLPRLTLGLFLMF